MDSDDFQEYYRIISNILPDPKTWNFVYEPTVKWLKGEETTVPPSSPEKSLPVEDLERSIPSIATDSFRRSLDDSALTDSDYEPDDGSRSSMDSSFEEGNSSSVENVAPEEERRCENCGTSETTMWRRSGVKTMCNACHLYSLNHKGKARPEKLWGKMIRSRNRRSFEGDGIKMKKRRKRY